jgi:hypothetical protein
MVCIMNDDVMCVIERMSLLSSVTEVVGWIDDGRRSPFVALFNQGLKALGQIRLQYLGVASCMQEIVIEVMSQIVTCSAYLWATSFARGRHPRHPDVDR